MVASSSTDGFEGHTLERFSGVVDRIYEAALRPSRWNDALQALAELQESPKCMLLTPYQLLADGGFVMAHGIQQADIQLWETRYHGMDILSSRAMERGLVRDGIVTLNEDLVTEDEFENAPIQEFYRRIDLYHTCVGVVFDGAGDQTAPTVCSVIRGRAAPPYTAVNRRLHTLTTVHLSRAIGTVLRLRNAEYRLASTTAALDRIASGVAILGERGQVVFANRAATETLSSHDGLTLKPGNPLTDQCGWLTADRQRDQDNLRRETLAAVSLDPIAATHFSGGISISRPSGKAPYIVRVSSLARDLGGAFPELPARAVAFISDTDRPLHVDPLVLRQAYGLSEAECHVAQQVLSGDSLEQVARRLSISENTVKTHLQRIYEKTGTHRQAQLVKLLAELAAARD